MNTRDRMECRYVTSSHERGLKSILLFLRYLHSMQAHKMQLIVMFESSQYLKRWKSYGLLQCKSRVKYVSYCP